MRRLWPWFLMIALSATGCVHANPDKDGGISDDGAVLTDAAGPGNDDGGTLEDGADATDAQDQDLSTDEDQPFSRERSCGTTFRFTPQGSVTSVQLAGEWDWGQPEDMSLSGSVYQLTRELDPGLYCYKFIVNGEWIMDPGNPYQAYCDGVLNSGMRVPDCRTPLLTLDGSPIADGTQFTARFLYHAAFEGSGPKSFTATLINNFTETPLDAAWNQDDWSLSVELTDLAPGKYNLRVEAIDEQDRSAEPLLLPFWIEEQVFDWRDALIYMVVTDRFVNGDPSNDPDPIEGAYAPADWKGGDLAGITQMIESGYFDRLGVRALWLTPLNTNVSGAYPDHDTQHLVAGFHGYWPIEPRQVDPRLGGPEDLKAIVAAAHDHGIRVLMDLVVNHVHLEHTYYQQHPGWFNDGCICGTAGCDWTAERLTCLFSEYMPDIDWKNREASEQFIADALWWFEEFDLDGARIDAVKHVDDLCVFNLATHIRERFEGASVDYYLDGETAMGWAGDNLEDNANEYGTINTYLGEWGLDGQFDFVLYHAVVKNVFIEDNRGAIHLDVWTGHSQTQYVPGSVMTPFIGSHDSSRIVTLADYRDQDPEHAAAIAYHKWEEQGLPEQPGEDEPYQRVRAAFCWLLTIPGAPMIYMGDEYGEFGGGDPDNRHVLRPEADLNARETALLAELRRLGALRRELIPLRRGGYQSLGSTEQVATFYRRTNAGEVAVVAVNISAAEQAVNVNLSGLGFSSGSAADRLDFGGLMQVNGETADITVPPRSCSVFTP